MSSVEFTTQIERGVINLPREFAEYENSLARVTITVETPEEKAAKKEQLFAAFSKIREADLFREVGDPVKWQRNLRDEWK
jgi:hypothetical protein